MVYLQADNDRTRPHHFDVACALFGAIEACKDYRLTTFEEVQSGKFNLMIKNNLFIGSVEFMREVFSKIGKYDIRVPMNSNREHKVITLGEAIDIAKSGQKIFVKPFEIKLFTGMVLGEMGQFNVGDVPNDTLVMSYDVFPSPIRSEFRCYIHEGRVVDIKNYSGDLYCVPDKTYLEDIIKQNRDIFPVAYTIDIGVLESGENVVVEYNDMWAIGNYGIPNYDYFRLLNQRYFEIVRS